MKKLDVETVLFTNYVCNILTIQLIFIDEVKTINNLLEKRINNLMKNYKYQPTK